MGTPKKVIDVLVPSIHLQCIEVVLHFHGLRIKNGELRSDQIEKKAQYCSSVQVENKTASRKQKQQKILFRYKILRGLNPRFANKYLQGKIILGEMIFDLNMHCQHLLIFFVHDSGPENISRVKTFLWQGSLIW